MFSSPSWSLELLDLGGRSYYDVMIRGQSSRLSRHMSPLFETDGFVLDSSALPKLPSDGALPVPGLKACLEGKRVGGTSACGLLFKQH